MLSNSASLRIGVDKSTGNDGGGITILHQCPKSRALHSVPLVGRHFHFLLRLSPSLSSRAGIQCTAPTISSGCHSWSHPQRCPSISHHYFHFCHALFQLQPYFCRGKLVGILRLIPLLTPRVAGVPAGVDESWR